LKNKTIKSAFFWQLLNVSFQAILQFAFIIISTRILPKEVHGTFAILNALIFVLTISSDGGVSSALIQKKNINKYHISIAFYFTLIVSLLLFITMFFLASPISSFYEGKIEIMEIRVASLVFIVMAVGKVSESFLIKDFRFKEIFISRSISVFIGNVIVLYILAINGFGIYAFIFAFLTAQVLQSGLNYYFAKHSFAFYWNKKELKELFFFGSSFTILRITNYAAAQMDKLLIGKFYSVYALSIYEKGQYISKMPSKYLGNVFDSVLFSTFSKTEKEQIKRSYFLKSSIALFSLGIYFSFLFFFNAELLVKVFLGKDWLDSIIYLQILSTLIPSILLARLGDVVVRAENKMYNSLPIKIVFLILIAGAILLFKEKPLVFVTKLIVGCYFAHGLMMIFISCKILKVRYLNILKRIVIITLCFVPLLAKYYFISILDISYIIKFLIYTLTDLLLIGIVVYIFRNNPIIKSIKQSINDIIRKRFKNKLNE